MVLLVASVVRTAGSVTDLFVVVLLLHESLVLPS